MTQAWRSLALLALRGMAESEPSVLQEAMAAGGGLTFLGVFRGVDPHKSGPQHTFVGDGVDARPLALRGISLSNVHSVPPLSMKSGHQGPFTFPTCAPELEASEKGKIRLICTSQETNYGNTYNLGREKYQRFQIRNALHHTAQNMLERQLKLVSLPHNVPCSGTHVSNRCHTSHQKDAPFKETEEPQSPALEPEQSNPKPGALATHHLLRAAAQSASTQHEQGLSSSPIKGDFRSPAPSYGHDLSWTLGLCTM